MPYNTMLIDDHSILRAGLRNLLELDQHFFVSKDVGCGQDAFASVTELQPDLVIMDVPVPSHNGVKAIQKIKNLCSTIKIVVLTAYNEERYIKACLSAGANAYMLKNDTYEDLLKAIHSVLKENVYVSPAISLKNAVAGINRSEPWLTDRSWEQLTRREHQILKLVAEGLKTKEIALRLCVSPKTVENHRANLLSKLNIKNTPALIYYAAEQGLL